MKWKNKITIIRKKFKTHRTLVLYLYLNIFENLNAIDNSQGNYNLPTLTPARKL